MKILILGSGGMLGYAFHAVFPDALFTDIDVNEKWLKYLDVRDKESCRELVKKSDIVMNLAAITDMELCEKNPLLSFGTNYIGAKNIAELCLQYNKELLYISTAGIFSDKNKKYFTDKDIPKPLSYYAISKYLGELASLKNPKTMVVRAGWMFGSGVKDKKFIMKIFKQIKEGKKEIYIVNDKSGTPTYTFDFAKGVKHIFETKSFGVYNQVCEGYTNRLEVARELIRLLNVDVKINEVNSDYFLKDYYAPRPDNEILKNSECIIMRSWKDCLNEYVNETLREML